MNKKCVYIYTIGCQMNVYDSEMFKKVLGPLGYIPVDEVEDADLVIVNTCTVRKKAEEKAFSFLGRMRALKKKNPELIVAIGGCVAQQEGAAILRRMPYVDIVFGTRAYGRLKAMVEKFEYDRIPNVDVEMSTGIVDETPTPELDAEVEVSRFVTIMRGCDNFCSYCIVPYVRGREESRDPDAIVQEVKDLVERGAREVTLLGQNVNSYGKKEGLCDFPELLRRVSEIEGLARIRFATSHPKDLSPGLVEAYRDLPKLCNHIHLPVQSGSNAVLKKMNRKYTREDYMERIARLKEVRPDIALTSDMIVGFPGETDDDFDKTLDLVRQVGFSGIFAFKYSDRPNAPAVGYDGKVSEEDKSRRLDALLVLEKELSKERNLSYAGKTEEVLVDGRKEVKGVLQWTGRTSCNRVVNFTVTGGDSDGNLVGKVVPVYIEEGLPHSLRGVLKLNRS
ncbi:tRNA-2-methylthio-N(6)-dimethylallyladenosine synthase [Desulfoluna limicola]|uniref:tRNA-2-methylthio-N(6)-dimethylallyladenosine synthase n=1 Tax=Desulfoluna limicola TaxID=2810562 RepID=A0ABM7PAW4_9BACT|nr:tRNA (N6-isopentenyl adenosine(37)-C2)-methylthiotransferase MiaB [Desulfoluna limicola]BCS94780.1 tRNA-2-methylthio-N(6)-dimethylallyladenosine synthase [Desulfoluna limicola]